MNNCKNAPNLEFKLQKMIQKVTIMAYEHKKILKKRKIEVIYKDLHIIESHFMLG